MFSHYHVFEKRLKDQQNMRRKVILAREEDEFYLSVMQYFLHVIFLCRAGLACVRHWHRIMEILDASIAEWISIALWIKIQRNLSQTQQAWI